MMVIMYYFELKVYGYNWVNMINVSMEFDVDILSLMYCLLIGVFGWSNVFEIFSWLGFDIDVINEVK